MFYIIVKYFLTNPVELQDVLNECKFTLNLFFFINYQIHFDNFHN